MIGMALVATMSVLGQSANKSIDKALDDGLNAQFVVSNAIGQPFSRRLPMRSPSLTASLRWRESGTTAQ